LVKAASQLGYVNEDDITSEILTSIKRAGADMIVTYFAKSASRFLQQS
jgi:porphobilinogen synthase